MQETKNAIKYVLLNEQRHTGSRKIIMDDFSSLVVLGHKFVLSLIKKEKLSLIWNQIRSPVELETGRSWLL